MSEAEGFLCGTLPASLTWPARPRAVQLARPVLLQGGKITYDKYASETSVEALTEMVVAEYRKALEERHRAAS
jgi:hypothetical protein